MSLENCLPVQVTNFSSVMCLFVLKVYVFSLERACAEGRGTGRRRESPKQTLCWTQSRHGSRSHNSEMMTWAQRKSRLLNRLCQPGTPRYMLLKWFLPVGNLFFPFLRLPFKEQNLFLSCKTWFFLFLPSLLILFLPTPFQYGHLSLRSIMQKSPTFWQKSSLALLPFPHCSCLFSPYFSDRYLEWIFSGSIHFLITLSSLDLWNFTSFHITLPKLTSGCHQKTSYMSIPRIF